MNTLTDSEMDGLSIRIVEMLNGVPMGQALAILEKRAPLLLKDGHLVNTGNARFTALKGTFESRDRATS